MYAAAATGALAANYDYVAVHGSNGGENATGSITLNQATTDTQHLAGGSFDPDGDGPMSSYDLGIFWKGEGVFWWGGNLDFVNGEPNSALTPVYMFYLYSTGQGNTAQIFFAEVRGGGGIW